tara:strand:- start:1882 stop:2625 length:744 start_codon:yes stop_codon:yes gene_type:complete
MKPSVNQDFPFSAFILALFLGVFSSLAIATGLIVIDAPAWGIYLFAALGGVTTASFVWIERSLVFQIKEKELLLGLEVTRQQEFQDCLYSHSMACLVRFDAGTLIIDRASPGFIKMLRMPMESELRGQSLDALLGVNRLKLESVVELIKQGGALVKEPKLELMSAEGFSTNAVISGQYFPDDHVVEAAFFVHPINNAERMADLGAAQKDLQRFRKGMFRRETRILELKEEVNEICREAGLPTRYEKV